jgi:hypothetical protein
MRSHSAAPTAALALGLFLAPPVSIATDAIINAAALLIPAAIGNLGSAGRAHEKTIGCSQCIQHCSERL